MSKCRLDIEKDIRVSYKEVLEKEVNDYIVKNDNALYSIELNYKGNNNKQSVKRKVYLANQKAGVNYGIYNSSNKIEINIPQQDIDIAWEAYQKANPDNIEPDENGQYTMFQLDKSKLAAADKKLDDQLILFLNQFGVTIKEINDFKKRFGIDALGATDVMQKLIYLSSKRNISTMPEEAAHMLVMLMGKNHPLIKEAFTDIENWSGYNAVKKDYMPIYKDENKVKIEALGHLIRDAVVNKYKSQNPIEKTLFQKIKDILDNFLKFIRDKFNIKKNDSVVYDKQAVVKIAEGMLAGDTSLVTSQRSFRYSNNVDYYKALNEDPLSKEIVNEYTEKLPFKLAGSLAIAKQTNIERWKNEQIHDLDFKVDQSWVNQNGDDAFDKLMDRPNIVKLREIKSEYSDYITKSYLQAPKGYKIETKREINANAPMFDINVYDQNGNLLSILEASKKIKTLDFFIGGNDELSFENVASWQDIFQGKLSMSPLGQKELMFNRPKDQTDYINVTPVNLQKSKLNNLYFQLSNEIKPGVEELFDSNPELANAVYEALGFNKMITPNDKVVFGHPTIGKTFLKEKGINNFISFDDDFAEEINNFVNAHKGSLDKYQYKQSKPKEYIDFSLSLYDKAKAQAKKEGKILFTSSNIIFGNRINDFDKVINLEREEFFKRIGERKTTYDIVAWKDQIDNLISKVDPNKVINTRLYLSDLLKNTTIKPTDKIIWGHPAIGKSYAAKKVKMIDFDSYKLGINRKYNLYIAPGLSDTELRTDDKTREARENWRYESEENQALWNQFIRDVWQQAKKDAKEQGAILFASDLLVLREFGNEVDKTLTMPDELFFERSKQRNNFIEGELGTKVWKGNLNRAVNNFKEKFGEDKVISTEKYLSDLFISPQQKQQALQLYSQYLDSIFPDSKVKDIVYRGAKKGIEKQKQTTYWTFRKRLAETFKTHGVMNVRLRTDEEGQLYVAVVNVKNPIKTMDISNSSLKEYKEEGKDAAIVFPTPINPKTGEIFEDFIEAIPFIDKNKNSELVIFEPEQIHILGGKQDIEGFKDFTNKEQKQLNNNATGMVLTPNEMVALNQDKELNEKIKCK